MEEERRLAFVAVTRAEKGLFLSEAEGRNIDGSPRYPSRFLLDINPALLTFTRQPDESVIQDAKRYIETSQNCLLSDEGSLFSAGHRVRHSVFGPGTVEDVDIDRAAYVIQFDDLPTPRKISFRAKLESVENS